MTVMERRRFERIYTDHYDAVLRYCLRRTKREDALDAAADTFVVAWRRRADLPADRPLPWLYGVAYKVLGNQWRTRNRQLRTSERLRAVAPDPDPGPEPQVVRAAEEQQVLGALAALRQDDREIIRLAAWEELSREDIAAALGCSPNAATKRLNRALDGLAAALGSSRARGQRFFRREGNSA